MLLAAVADRAPKRRNPARQRRLGDDSAAPDFGKQIILADNPLALADQEAQEIEDLRLDRDDLGATPQLAPVDVE